MEEKIIPNPDVELKNYIIISQYLEKKEEDKDKDIEFELPTPETIEKLCEPQIVKNRLNFDFKKYSSFFEGDKLNLDKIESLKDTEKTKFLLMFLGFINSKHDIYSLYDQEIEVYEEKRFIDNVQNYSIYLDYCIDYLKSIDKCFDSIQDFDTFMKILSEVGINIENQEKNDLYLKIKQDLFLSKGKNKILILIAPSNNFWIKSEKSSINEQNYDKKLNNYTNIFYNKNFIKKFMQQVVANPRCHFGLISSMMSFWLD